jgi:hypothetical protein
MRGVLCDILSTLTGEADAIDPSTRFLAREYDTILQCRATA